MSLMCVFTNVILFAREKNIFHEEIFLFFAEILFSSQQLWPASALQKQTNIFF